MDLGRGTEELNDTNVNHLHLVINGQHRSAYHILSKVLLPRVQRAPLAAVNLTMLFVVSVMKDKGENF